MNFLSSLHPLNGRLRAALRREDQLNGSVPVSVISICDGKTSNYCKYINPEVESHPVLIVSLLLRAATTFYGFISVSEDQFSLKRRDCYDPEIMQSVINQPCNLPESTSIEAIYIPYSADQTIVPRTLTVSSNGYYLDVIAQELGVTDASKLLIVYLKNYTILHRTIGRASSETRVYYRAPKLLQLDLSSETLQAKAVQVEGSLNVRVSYFCGSYKKSRDAIVSVDLPAAFTTRTNWRGSSPKDLLLAFCRQHHLSEPLFPTTSDPLEPELQLP